MVKERCPYLKKAEGNQIPCAVCEETGKIISVFGERFRKPKTCEFKNISDDDCRVDSKYIEEEYQWRGTDEGLVQVNIKYISDIHRDTHLGYFL